MAQATTTLRTLTLAVAVAACGAKSATESGPPPADVTVSPVAGGMSESIADRPDAEQAMVKASPARTENAAMRGVAAAAPAAPTAPAVTRMIVRTARVSMQVADVRRAVESATALTGEVKGFLGDSRFWREGDAERASLTLRVPADALDATLARLRALSVRVDDESTSGEDVTRQAVDLNAQLTNLRATEVELRALLVTVRQNAKRASEVLEVHQELTRIRGEIEQHTAELQSLTQLAAMSTITLELRPDVVAVPVADGGWQPRGVLRDAVRALLDTGHALVNTAIWAVVYAAPLLLVAAAVLAGVLRAWRLLRRRPASMAPTA